MSQAVAYNRLTSFTNFQSANPTSPPNGSDLDAEFNAVKTTTDQLRQNAALIQRDDGKLANSSVTRDQLAPDVAVGFNKPTPWAQSTSYGTSDTVFFNAQFFGCITSHISGAVFDSTKWKLIADFSGIAIAAASNVAFTPTGNVSANTVQAAIAEVDAEKALLVHTHLSTDISDSTAAGRTLLTAASVAAQLSALGIINAPPAPGDLKNTAAILLPTGWLWCDGGSQATASFAALFAAISITTTGNTSNTSPIITNIPDTSNMRAGMPVNGTNISGFAATILTVDSATQITISANATGSQTSGALIVAPWGMADATHFNVPDFRGREQVGRDDMNGSAAGRVTVAGTGTLGTRLGNTGGAETVTLTVAKLPVITPAGTIANTDPGHTHTAQAGSGSTFTGGGVPGASTAGNTGSSTTGITSAFTGTPFGSGQAHQNMGPFGICNVLIKT